MKLILVFLISAFAGKRLVDLDQPALETIKIGSVAILRETSEADLLVFIGNSPSYFFHGVNTFRRSKLIPFSGVSKFDRLDVLQVPKEFDDVFLEPIRSEATLKNMNIVLIDYSASGRSVDVFNTMLGMNDRTEFIQLVPDFRFPFHVGSPKSLKTRSVIVLPAQFSKLADGDYVRLVPEFYSSQWRESSPNMLPDFDRREGVRNNIAEITKLIPSIASESLESAYKDGRMVNMVSMISWRAPNRQPESSLAPNAPVDLSVFVELAREAYEETLLSDDKGNQFDESNAAGYIREILKKSELSPTHFDIHYVAFRLAESKNLSSFYYPADSIVKAACDLGKFIVQDDYLFEKLAKVYTQLVLAIEVPDSFKYELLHATGVSDILNRDPSLLRADLETV